MPKAFLVEGFLKHAVCFDQANGIGPRQIPTNAQYGQALYKALPDAGIQPDEAASYAGQAVAQRIEKGLAETGYVPWIPGTRK